MLMMMLVMIIDQAFMPTLFKMLLMSAAGRIAYLLASKLYATVVTFFSLMKRK
jgi:hypothetical protein